MKTTIVEKTEKELTNPFIINDITIAGQTFSLEINNWGDTLSMELRKQSQDACGFQIVVNEHGKIVMSRDVFRPRHDHDDIQYLNEGLKWGEFKKPRADIDFGPITIDY